MLLLLDYTVPYYSFLDGEENLKMMMKMKALMLLLLPLAAEAIRVKRVKAGMHYKQHDPVHVVVNKVG